jgi:hypothetical protein
LFAWQFDIHYCVTVFISHFISNNNYNAKRMRRKRVYKSGSSDTSHL